MADEINEILKKSSKAELLEALNEELVNTDKAIVILITDKEEGKYTSIVYLLGIKTTYESYGILEVAKEHLEKGVAGAQ